MTGLQIQLAVGLPLVLALVALISWQVIGRALGPVESIRAQVAEIGAAGESTAASQSRPGTTRSGAWPGQ